MAVEWTDLGGSHTLAFAAGSYRLSVLSLEGTGQEAPRWLVSRTACQIFRDPWGHPPSLSWSCAASGPGLGSLQVHSWPGGPSYSRLGRRLPPPTGPWTLVAAGAQTARTDETASPSPPPSSLGCTPASLPLRAGHSGHRLDSVGLRRTALLPPRRRGPDQRDAAPLPLRALAAAAAGDWPRAAQCPAQCPGQCPLPPAHMEDLGYAPLEAWVRGLKQSGAGLGFRRGSRQTLTGLRSRVCGA